ncbi:MAG TPA: sulfate adenylyltransferase small subunit, partial [Caldilineaceae bacterium]|nr:sulfate adenylyltransferase small subunit [Caldilineaceae bacterium]
VKRDGMWMATWPSVIEPLPDEEVEHRLVRFRTIGDISCTGAVESSAATLRDVIQEIAAARITERGGRADDRRSEAAMEDRKKVGYF